MAAKRKYEWERWLVCGRRTVLVRGIDYFCSQSAMAGMIRNNASQRGKRVALVDSGGSISIEVTGEIQRSDQVTIAGEPESQELEVANQDEEEAEKSNRAEAEVAAV